MKVHKPTTPGRRGMKTISYRNITSAKKPIKALTHGFKRAKGRNNSGRITVRHIGGGHKRLWREVDFLYNKHDIPAIIKTIEYDPNRSALIGLAAYADGERRYIVLPKNVKVGDSFSVSENAPLEPANRLPLKNIPIGTFVFNVEIKPGNGAKLARSAGVYIEVVAHDKQYTNLKMPSGEIRKVQSLSWATIGESSNSTHKLIVSGKAGRTRWLGKRPHVRGSAMNPVDHPHGGGEGRQGIGLRRGPKTPWGKLAYGVKTRRVKKYSTPLIVSRRKSKKRK